MNNSEIDEILNLLVNASSTEDIDIEDKKRILRMADINFNDIQDVNRYVSEHSEEIFEKIMNEIDEKNFDYFISKLKNPQYKELCLGFLAYSHSIDNIKKIIASKEELNIDNMEMIELILNTGDSSYIKSFINKSISLGFNENEFLYLAEYSALKDYKVILKLIKNPKIGYEKTVRIINEDGSLNIKDAIKNYAKDLHSSEIVSLISLVNDTKYIKSIIENNELRKELRLNNVDITNLIKAVKDPEYTKSIIENAELYKELGLNSTDITNLIKAIEDPEYIKSVISNTELHKNIGLNSINIVNLIKGTNDTEYIKSIIEDDELRKELGINNSDIIDLIKAVKDPEYIKSIIENDELNKKFGLNDIIYNLVSALDENDKNEYIKKKFPEYYLSFEGKDSIKEVDLPKNMTIGIEIESEGKASELIDSMSEFFEDWETKGDGSLKNGVEVVSPILTGGEESSVAIKTVCHRLSMLGQEATERCGGHIHIGSDYLTTEESWETLVELLGNNNEEILYTISNKEGEIPRSGVVRYAKPTSEEFQKKLEKGTVSLETEEDLKKFVKKSQNGDRYYGISFDNLGNEKNTIEFRLSNGTVDANTWIENINLFGGIIRTSEELGLIKRKPEAERNETEKRKLELLEKVTSEEISNEEKLEILLELVIKEEDRNIYRGRYQVNSRKIDENQEIKQSITDHVASDKISISKIKDKVFSSEERVTGDEYAQMNSELEKIKTIERELEENQMSIE